MYSVGYLFTPNPKLTRHPKTMKPASTGTYALNNALIDVMVIYI